MVNKTIISNCKVRVRLVETSQKFRECIRIMFNKTITYNFTIKRLLKEVSV
jgi:hypothetical protein